VLTVATTMAGLVAVLEVVPLRWILNLSVIALIINTAIIIIN